MSAPAPKTAADTVRAAAEAIPAPEGWTWSVVGYMRYEQACRDGIPTLHIEYHADDDIELAWLIGQRVNAHV